jgi:hypothetical protein
MQQLNEIHAAKRQEFEDLLIEDFKYYAKNISGFAVSIQYCICLLCLCERYGLTSIIDLGSGFTSYALRRYRKAYDKDLAIYTVDNDPYWLSISCHYCEEKSLSDEFFYLWDDFKDKAICADLVSMDIDTSILRSSYLVQMFKMARRYIMVDDMHKARIRRGLDAALRAASRGYEYLLIKHLTYDECGRYAVLVDLEKK